MGQFPKTDSDVRALCDLATKLLDLALVGAGEIEDRAERAAQRVEYVLDPNNADHIEPDHSGHFAVTFDELTFAIDTEVPHLRALLLAAMGLIGDIRLSDPRPRSDQLVSGGNSHE